MRTCWTLDLNMTQQGHIHCKDQHTFAYSQFDKKQARITNPGIKKPISKE